MQDLKIVLLQEFISHLIRNSGEAGKISCSKTQLNETEKHIEKFLTLS